VCRHGDTVALVLTTIRWSTAEDPPDHDPGPPFRRVWSIDRCIAPIVQALDAAGVYMLGSCCAHGRGPGSIDLADGRTLVLLGEQDRPIVEAFVNSRWGR
jgi:hypothetical protein